MARHSKIPTIPPSRLNTDRQSLLEMLEETPQDARELSQRSGIPEREVYTHLSHLERSLNSRNQQMTITPAKCTACGFTFDKRGLFKKPSRCPDCRNERISPPLYAIK